MERIAERYQIVLEQIASAARRVGREPGDIKLVVVTKGHQVEHIKEVIAAGARWLGENYVEESLPKIQALSDNQLLTWHMIGHLQSRKAEEVVDHFDWMQAVDSLKIARRLDHFCALRNRKLPVLLEFNMSGEQSKFGWYAGNEFAWEKLLAEIDSVVQLPHIVIRGVMTLAPYFPDAEHARPIFRQLRKLSDFLADKVPGANWNELSMGMSADLVPAIEEGATIVRVGQAIMGPRPIRD